MLLDMQRLARVIDRRFPPRPGSRPLMWRVEHSLVAYVKGQFLLSLIIGTSAGVGMWLLGVTGLVPGADTYALLFGLLRRVHRADPVPRPVARRAAAVLLRARGAPGVGALGRAALPLHPPGRGARRRPERDGLGAAAAPAARDLRAARRRRDLRAARDLRRAAAARRPARGVGVLQRADRARAVGGGREAPVAGRRRGPRRRPRCRASSGAASTL